MRKEILLVVPIIIGAIYYIATSEEEREVLKEPQKLEEVVEEEELEAPIVTTMEKLNRSSEKKSSKEDTNLKLIKEKKVVEEDEESIDKFKEEREEIIVDVNDRILKELSSIPKCLEKAKDKRAAFECSKDLRSMQRELSVLRRDSETIEIKEYDDKFIWNEETKKKMIEGLKSSITEMEQTNNCVGNYKDPEKLAECLEIRE